MVILDVKFFSIKMNGHLNNNFHTCQRLAVRLFGSWLSTLTKNDQADSRMPSDAATDQQIMGAPGSVNGCSMHVRLKLN